MADDRSNNDSREYPTPGIDNPTPMQEFLFESNGDNPPGILNPFIWLLATLIIGLILLLPATAMNTFIDQSTADTQTTAMLENLLNLYILLFYAWVTLGVAGTLAAAIYHLQRDVQDAIAWIHEKRKPSELEFEDFND